MRFEAGKHEGGKMKEIIQVLYGVPRAHRNRKSRHKFDARLELTSKDLIPYIGKKVKAVLIEVPKELQEKENVE